MLGYVICEKPEMKVKEYELYNGYYCGVCKSVGSRYGHVPRAMLSYDSAFLAVLLAGMSFVFSISFFVSFTSVIARFSDSH